jgi:hypothetical protein
MPWWMKNNLTGRAGIVFAPDGAGGGVTGDPAPAAVDPAPAAAPADAGSVLYPDDQPKADGEQLPADQPAGEGEAKAEGEGEAKADDAAADTVPEDGKYDLKMPEGVEVDQAMLDQFAPTFKELGLTTKQAQALADKFIEAQTKQGDAQRETWAKMTGEWVDQAKADPEIGGAKWDATVKDASGIVKRFGNDALRDYLNASGAGNHPEMIRFMAKVGAMIGEDRPAISEAPGKKIAQDTAAILYPDDQPKGR